MYVYIYIYVTYHINYICIHNINIIFNIIYNIYERRLLHKMEISKKLLGIPCTAQTR